MEIRLLIAFLLMGLVLFVTPYFYKPPAGPKRTTPAPAPAQATQETKQPAAPQQPPPAPAALSPGQIGADKEQTFTVDTALYRVQLSNIGGVVRNWTLKKFLDSRGKPLELVNEAALAKTPPPFAIIYKDGNPAAQLNAAKFKATPTADGLGVDYEYSDGQTHCVKTFRFAQNSYLSQIASQVTKNGAGIPHLLEWRGGFGDLTVLNRSSAQQTVYYDLSNSKLNTMAAGKAKNGPVTAAGTYSFAGIEDTFFAAVMLPKEGGTTEVQTYKDDLTASKDAKPESFVGVGVGGDAVNDFSVFVGPKDIDILKRVDPRLPQLIDWGFFGIIAKPLFQALHWINDRLVHNYGWAIVLITIIINVALLPLRFKSMKSAKKMQALQPQIKAINAKYKDVGLRDPKKAEQNQEVMDLYKREGVNPMGGCLPMVVQLPLLYAFYRVLAVTIELRGAHWLWVTDLTQAETLPIHVLPIVMVVTQFLMQRMTPNPSADQSQARMMAFMPLFFGFFFYNMSSGLVLYWLTGNVVGIAQQWIMNKTTPPPVVATPPPQIASKKLAPKKKKG